MGVRFLGLLTIQLYFLLLILLFNFFFFVGRKPTAVIFILQQLVFLENANKQAKLNGKIAPIFKSKKVNWRKSSSFATSKSHIKDSGSYEKQKRHIDTVKPAPSKKNLKEAAKTNDNRF